MILSEQYSFLHLFPTHYNASSGSCQNRKDLNSPWTCEDYLPGGVFKWCLSLLVLTDYFWA